MYKLIEHIYILNFIFRKFYIIKNLELLMSKGNGTIINCNILLTISTKTAKRFLNIMLTI